MNKNVGFTYTHIDNTPQKKDARFMFFTDKNALTSYRNNGKSAIEAFNKINNLLISFTRFVQTFPKQKELLFGRSSGLFRILRVFPSLFRRK